MIRFVPQTGSTNQDVIAALSGGDYVREGEWVVADRQLAGKGRLGRPWSDGLGNFMGSCVVRPGAGDPSPASLALLTGLAVHEAVCAVVPDASGLLLKWPNDLLWSGAKIAGILLEMAHGAVVVGIGVNIASAPEVEGRNVSALVDHGYTGSRDDFAQALELCFARELERWRTGGLAPLLRRWQSAAHPCGARLTVLPPGEPPIEGLFDGLGEDGSLLLRLADGSQRTIHAGDVLFAADGN